MASKSSKLKEKQVVAKFDPRKNYQWQVDDVFAINGSQLDALFKLIVPQLNSPEVQKAIALLESHKIITSIIEDGYNEGIVKEAPPAEQVEQA